ncbi:MAG TPA: sulfatase-like hydrolase/transferase [Sediminibacterium sp.]|nr:sulfatase-like hydrolase/transferase [Sediminibacterium sp.]
MYHWKSYNNYHVCRVRSFSCLLIWLLISGQLAAQNAKRPNMILILTDDLGWSCFSSQMDSRIPDSKSDYFETPYIDRFVTQGMHFTHGYAPDPICTPSRRSIQFGQTSLHEGDATFPQVYAPEHSAAHSIPNILKSLDPMYRAAHFGKWDLRAKITPAELGYDESDGDTGNKNGDIVKDKEEKWTQHYITGNPKQMDSITARSIRFMQDEVNTHHPFYLQVSHYATHVNFETNDSSYQRYLAKMPGKKHTNPAWAGMIHDLDKKIGELLAAVDALGIADNTYIFLMADNGAVEFIPPVNNRLDPPDHFDHPMRNYPLRGGKWTLYEGGIRVPFIVRGPGIKAGSESDVPVAGWDLLPTIYAMAGGKGTAAPGLDGGNILPVLQHDGKGKVQRGNPDFYFHRYNNGYPHSAIISGDYKLIHFWKTKKTELYNIKQDIGELHDLSSAEPEIVQKLGKKLDDYIRSTNPEILTKY